MNTECIMENRKPAPMSLKIIAVLFFLSGAWALFDFLSRLGSNVYFFNFGVLGIPIAWGLMNYRANWRKCALFFIWIAFFVLATLTVVTLVGNSEIINIWWFGKRIEPTTTVRLIACSIYLVLSLPFLWMYRVLTNPDIRALFGVGVPYTRTTTDPAEVS